MDKKIVDAVNTPATGYFTYDHIKKTIVGSEFHFKKAGNPGNPQYKELMFAMSQHPTYLLSPVASKKKSEKQTYAGLTRELMKAYIEIQSNNEKVIAEFEQMMKDQKCYPTMKSWFLETYKGFDVKRAEAAIRTHKLNTYKAQIRRIQPVLKSVIDRPKAANE